MDAKISFLNNAILEAAQKYIGRVKASTNDKVWLTREIREQIKLRNNLRKNIANNRQEWITACRKVNDMIRSKKEEHWKTFLEDSEASANPNKIWNAIKALSGKATGNTRNESLIHEGKEFITSKSKANAFMNRYAEISRTHIPKQERCKKLLRKRLNSPTVPDQSTVPFTEIELSNAIDSAKAKGAPGEDQISPRFIKALGPLARSFLLDLFNDSWAKGTCPASWRTATIIPLLKKGKPSSAIDSYRPVSLTSCMAKTMERMVATRLSYLAETRGWWCPEQSGFRRQRCCEDQILRLSQSISDGFQSRPPLRSVISLLDFSKAFDTVWRNRLLHILLDKGVPTAMTRWIQGFICDRHAKVSMDNVTGKRKKLHQGVPQGSVLSPLLFLFYIDGIKEVISPEVKISLYADDIAIWSQHRDKLQALAHVQDAVSNIANWSSRHKLKLNPSKCEVSFFSTDTHEAKWIPAMDINGTPLTFNATPTFLGITFDRTLCFRRHTDQIKSRTAYRTRILASLATKQWGWSRKSLKRIFQSIISSVFNYCAAGWQLWLAKSNLLILERAQNRALRVITGQLADTPIECLRCEAEIPSIETTRRRNCLIAWEKSARLPASNPRAQLTRNTVYHRWKNRLSFSQMATADCIETGLSSFERDTMALSPVPPWTQRSNPHWSVATRLLNGSTKTTDQAELKKDATDTINALHHPDVIIYTDGSAQGGCEFGGSAAVFTTGTATDPLLLDERCSKGRRWTSSFETEVTAINLAIQWLEDQSDKPCFAIICSDSQSTLAALENTGNRDSSAISALRAGLDKVTTRIHLQWVPSHIGLTGNEWADVAAGVIAADRSTAPEPYISLPAAKSVIKATIIDPPPSDPRTKAIYGSQRSDVPLSRKEAVLLAQLRSGHCQRLAAYKHRIDSSTSPICPHCETEEETITHWLTECPATINKRVREFGGAAPPLSVLVGNPKAVLSYAQGLWSL